MVYLSKSTDTAGQIITPIQVKAAQSMFYLSESSEVFALENT